MFPLARHNMARSVSQGVPGLSAQIKGPPHSPSNNAAVFAEIRTQTALITNMGWRVTMMVQSPTTHAVEKQVARDYESLQPWIPRSTSTLTDNTIEKRQGPVTLKEMLGVLNHVYELHMRYLQNPEFRRAFTAPALKVTRDASQAGGSWELSWPLLGLLDPEEHDQHARLPTEHVTIVALAKEKMIVSEIGTATRMATAARRLGNSCKKAGIEEV